jgi:hypothetical protein
MNQQQTKINPRDITVFIQPVSWHFLRNEMFDPNSRYNIDNDHEPYFYLRQLFDSKGIEVHTADYLMSGEKTNKINVYFSLGMIENYRQLATRPDVILSSFFTFEAPITQPSTYRALRDISKFFKRIYCYTTGEALARFGCADLKFQKLYIPYPFNNVFDELWRKTDRKFLTLLNSNRLCRMKWQELYTERLRALQFFSQHGEIDLYGFKWDQPPFVVGETWIPVTFTRIHRYLRKNVPFLRWHPAQEAILKSYRGAVKSKFDVQSNYVFTICYENMMLPGWLNENIFDCFLVGTIPIFLGPPDITDYVPAECFIDKRQFPTYPELRSFLKSLSQKEIQTYRENGRAFVESDKFKPFLKEAFADMFVRAVEEDVGVNLRGQSGG